MKGKRTKPSWLRNILVLLALGLAVPALGCVGQGGGGQGASMARGDSRSSGAASDATANTIDVTLEVTGMT